VKTDACKTGFGSILAQEDENGKEVVIGYASRKTKPYEQNYSASELECAAVVWALCSKWRSYVYLSKFTLVTDHHSLRWLMNTRNLTGKLARWSLHLQEFDFEVVYRPGKQHADVDSLSRATGLEEEEMDAGSEEETHQQDHSQVNFCCSDPHPFEMYSWDQEYCANCQKELRCQEDLSNGEQSDSAGSEEEDSSKPITVGELPPLTRYGKRLTPGTPEWVYFMVNVIIGDGASRTDWGFGQDGEWSAEILHGSGNYVWMMILRNISDRELDYNYLLDEGTRDLEYWVESQRRALTREGRTSDFYDPHPLHVTVEQLQAALIYWRSTAAVWAAQEVLDNEMQGRTQITPETLQAYADQWLVPPKDLEKELIQVGVSMAPENTTTNLELPPLTKDGKQLTPGTPQWVDFMVKVIIGKGASLRGKCSQGERGPELKPGSGNYLWMMMLHAVSESNLNYNYVLNKTSRHHYWVEYQREALREQRGRNSSFYAQHPPQVTARQLHLALVYWRDTAPVWAAQNVVDEGKGRT
jgi:hypothetical protein